MTEPLAQEISLRDIVETLKRQRAWVLAPPLIFGVVAVIYAFFLAEPRYAATATLSVSPIQVKAQLEERIQAQEQNFITFEGLRALAFSQEIVRKVWERLEKEGNLPASWQDQGSTPGLERMLRDFRLRNESSQQHVVVAFSVQAPTPEVAAQAANLWAELVRKRVNTDILSRLEAKKQALEQQLASAEKAYREAQARWEAFRRTSTLDQDLAELYFLQGIAPFAASSQAVLLGEQVYGERLRFQQALNNVELELGVAGAQDRPKLLAKKAALQARIAQVEGRIALLRERVARAQVEQDRLNQALELAKNAFLALSQKKTDLQIELASSQNSLAQIIAPAYPIYEKVAPKRGLIFAVAVALGLMLGVMAAFVAEALRGEGRPQAA